MNKKVNAHDCDTLYKHLLKDAEEILQLKSSALDSDFERITGTSKSRSYEQVYLLRFPELCSELEGALESGVYTGTEGALFSKKGYPTIFRDIYALIFDADWALLVEPNIEAIRILRQIFKLMKKHRIDCPDIVIKEKIDEFVQIEAELPVPSLSWGSDDLQYRGYYPSLTELGDLGFHTEGQLSGQFKAGWGDGEILSDLSAIQHLADKLSGSFRIHWSEFRPKHGPGAVSEPYRTSKYEFPSWPERLNQYFPFDKWGVVNELNVPLEACAGNQPAKLIHVPKDFRGPRLIASEPISSQYIQQGIMRSLRNSLRSSVLRNCYDPKSQEHSRVLTLTSSKDRSFSTIDLSSASDRMSCWLVERIFRKNYGLLQAFNAARTPEVLLPDGSVVWQKKFAAQGAAFTFPVQSLVYAIVCMGVIYSSNPRARFNDIARKVRVFGDDIIVPTEYYNRVCNALEALFLKVNRKKSFSKGLFRESCGMDAYAGHDVSACSVLNFFHARRPEDTLSLVECSNNLYLKGFIRASSALRDMIPEGIRKDIPFVSPGTKIQLGFYGSGVMPTRSRWNAYWHIHESKVLVVETKVHKTRPSGSYSLLQWFVEEPAPDSINWEPGEVTSVKARYRLRWVPTSTVGRA